MSLISVTKGDIDVGIPLPWPLYDQAGGVLMEAGSVIPTPSLLEAMLAANPLRELTLPTFGDAPALVQGTDAPSTQEAQPAPSEQTFNFNDMRLRVGDRIQLQLPATVSQERFIVKLMGYLENASLLVTSPMENGLRVPLRDNDKLVARIFTSQKAFGFNCFIKRVCKIPYDYLHLSFPGSIQGSVVRKSPRVRTKIIAAVSRPNETGENKPLSGMIVNISADGALLRARQPLSNKDDMIRISFRVNLHNVDAFLTVNAIVRGLFLEEANTDNPVPMHNHGLQFQELRPNDSVILQSLIYQQMIEQPQSLV